MEYLTKNEASELLKVIQSTIDRFTEQKIIKKFGLKSCNKVFFEKQNLLDSIQLIN